MKLSRTMVYAIQALVQLAIADSPNPVPCSRLAHEGKMPERFLLQILHDLVKHKLLRSTRGVDGGYSFARKPSEISLMDIFNAFDNPLIPSVPPLEKLSDETRKRLLDSLGAASAAARKELATVSVADLLIAEPVND